MTVFCKKKVFLKISQNSQQNTYARIYSFNKVTGLRPATLLKKRRWHRCFPVNFAKFLRTFFLQTTSGRLLLKGHLNLNKPGSRYDFLVETRR